MKQIIILSLFLAGCSIQEEEEEEIITTPYAMVLGVAQDAGYPQMNCSKACCEIAWKNPKLKKMTSCIAIVDPTTKQQWIIDATPNIKDQIQLLKSKTNIDEISGVLLTHAHMGHYIGLLHFGREVMGAHKIPVFAMPKMNNFLKTNGPWSQLVTLENINLNAIKEDSIFHLNENIKVTPFLVPHRDEFSETVGYKINVNNKSLIFIPDIDKWQKWDTNINKLIKKLIMHF